MRAGRLGILATAIAMFGAAVMAPTAGAAPPAFMQGKPFGFSAPLQPPGEPAGSTRVIDAARAAGASHMRIVVHWRAYETETSVSNPVPPSFNGPVGVPTFNGQTNHLDQDYLAITSRGMTPLILVMGAPHWASTFHKCDENILYRLDSKKCPPDWKTNALVLYPDMDRLWHLHAFAAALARRYPLAIFEGTNEPDFNQIFQARYHPPIWMVAEGQCALNSGVKSVDPSRTVLSASFYLMPYAHSYFGNLKGRGCFDHMSFHPLAGGEVRSGPASGITVRLAEMANISRLYHDARPFWVTETGMSDTQTYNANRDMLGEPLVARALPRWVTNMAANPNVGALLLYSLRDSAHGQTGDAFGHGQVDTNFAVKNPGPGVIPRMCWFVLQAGNQYPGCEGMSLPSPQPGPPTFFKYPYLVIEKENPVGKVAGALFFEEGHPLPNVSVVWYACNSLGLGCVPIAYDTTSYLVQPKDRYKRIKVHARITNEHGTVAADSALSDLIV